MVYECTRHVSKIFGDKRFLMIFPMEFWRWDKIGILESMEQEKYSAENHCRGIGDDETGDFPEWLSVSPICLRCQIFQRCHCTGLCIDGKWQKDWSTESEARNILNKLTEHDVPVEQLSGGQKKRVALARTLVNPF